MTSKQHTNKRILNLVAVYKQTFPEEYKIVSDGIIMQRQILEDETGKLKGEHAGPSAQRVLHEMPEKLYQSLVQTLDGDELTYFKSVEGARWFTHNVPEFALAKV